jgi:hypothetical protein
MDSSISHEQPNSPLPHPHKKPKHTKEQKQDAKDHSAKMWDDIKAEHDTYQKTVERLADKYDM